jgi:hypothetical protein
MPDLPGQDRAQFLQHALTYLDVGGAATPAANWVFVATGPNAATWLSAVPFAALPSVGGVVSLIASGQPVVF